MKFHNLDRLREVTGVDFDGNPAGSDDPPGLSSRYHSTVFRLGFYRFASLINLPRGECVRVPEFR